MTRLERLGLWLAFTRADVAPSVVAVVLVTAPLWGPVVFR